MIGVNPIGTRTVGDSAPGYSANAAFVRRSWKRKIGATFEPVVLRRRTAHFFVEHEPKHKTTV